MREFVRDLGVGDFDHVIDADGELWLAFEIPVRSSFAFVGADGSVERHLGPASIGEDELRTRVRALADGAG
jgi:hypothetical protein